MIRLTTSRLILRAPEMDDAEAIAGLLADFEVSGNLARVRHPYRVEDARDWLEQIVGEKPVNETGYVICLRDGTLIGDISFHERTPGLADLGYYLGKAHWGRGYMTEAATGALDWYFGASDADKVRSGLFDFNAASMRVQEKLGFTVIGQSTVHSLARGKDCTHIDTELSRADWEARKQ